MDVGKTYRNAPSGGRINRREFLRLGGAGLAGVALLGASGCGGGQQEPASNGATQITLGFGPDNAGGLVTLVDQFNQQHSGEIEVRWREMQAASDDYFEQIRTEFEGGSPTLDVIGGDVIWTAQLAAPGYVLDISDRFTDGMRSDFLEGPLESGTYDGKTWGVPWFMDAGMFYYRQDLLEEAGYSEPPATWDEMREMADRILADTDTQFGYVFQGAADEGGVVDALEHIWNAGGDVLQDDQVVINSPEAVDGLTVRRGMIEGGVAPRASGNYTTQESQSQFTNGSVAFMRNWPFVYGLLSNEEESQVRPEQVGIAPIPVEDPENQSFSGLGGWNLLVSAASEEKIEEIWTFIEWMTAPEQQQTFAVESTRLPTREALYEDGELLDQVPVADLGREALRNARPRPVSPYYSDMSLAMSEQFNAQLNGNVSAEEALETLQQELQNIVDQA